MTIQAYLSMTLFIVVLVNDYLFTRSARRAIRLRHPNHPELMLLRSNFSPIGIVTNVLRFKSIEVLDDIPQAERRRINIHFRIQQIALVLLAVLLVLAIARNGGAA
jgi:hypothetical protein